MISNRVGVGAADPEADALLNLCGQRAPVGDVHRAQGSFRRQVAAPDVVADARRRNEPAVGDDAADRHRVADVPVRTEHPTGAALSGNAALELRDGPAVMGAEDR